MGACYWVIRFSSVANGITPHLMALPRCTIAVRRLACPKGSRPGQVALQRCRQQAVEIQKSSLLEVGGSFGKQRSLTREVLLQRRMNSSTDPNASGTNQPVIVQAQYLNRGTFNRSSANNVQPICAPRKMLMPILRAGIEQRNGFAAARIGRRQPRAFEFVAAIAAQRKVMGIGRAAGGLRNNMVHHHGHADRLWAPAITASMPITVGHMLAQAC